MENLRRLLPYLRTHRKSLIISVVCMILSGALDGAFFFLFKTVLGQILKFDTPDRMTRLNYFMLVMVGWALMRGIVDFYLTYNVQRTGQRVLTHLRSDLFTHFQNLSVGFFEQRRTGEIMSRMTNDLSMLQNVLTGALVTSIRAPIVAVVSIGFMVRESWQLSFFILVILPPIMWLVYSAGRKIRVASSQLQRQLADLTTYLQEKIAAMRLIQTFGTKPYEIALFDEINTEAYRRTMRPIRIQASLGPSIEFVAYMGVLVVLWFGARERMAPEALVAFLFAMQKAAMSLKSLASLNTTFKSAESAAERLFEMLDTRPQVHDKPDALDLAQRPVEGHLAFENVRFTYGSGDEVLHGISFEVKPGEVVGLAGPSGSGKTTITSLVPRLYDPTHGRLTLDGLDLRDITLQSLRSNIGAVPQETTLFHGTIRDNIAYGSPHATPEQVEEAARRANAHDFIIEQPDGYNTHIGERGTRLSGGQRQRIAIARALLRNPRVLILDEATSSLDPRSEALVQDALSRLMEGRTTLIIAHRFSTIRHADRIIVLDKGAIAESGTHDELLQRGGLYQRLYEMQAFTREEADSGEINGETGDDLAAVAGTTGSSTTTTASATVAPGTKPALPLSIG
jgi:ATP-binding cassette, subfamily B, bacterial MsbA